MTPFQITPADMPRILRLDSARPLREWAVIAHVLVQDINFDGDLDCTMAWAAEPAAGVLDYALAILVKHRLTDQGYVPGKMRYDVASVKISLIS